MINIGKPLAKYLDKDNLILGLILGLLIPIPTTLFFAGLLRLVQNQFNFLTATRDVDIILLGAAVNLIVMRFYFIKYRHENTGKGLLFLTVIMILAFFIFLKNSNFVFPF